MSRRPATAEHGVLGSETLNLAVTGQDRRDLFDGLEEAIGAKPANKVMELLPNQPADQLATHTDMGEFGDVLRAQLRAEMAELRRQHGG